MNADKNDYSIIITIELIENRTNNFYYEFFDKVKYHDEKMYLYNITTIKKKLLSHRIG